MSAAHSVSTLGFPALLRAGDWLVLLAGGILVGALLVARPSAAERVLVKQGGQVFAEASLRLDRVIAVPGPLGATLVEIRAGQVRVQSDPSPRQLCVRQGWLAPGAAALCLPNRVSVERGFARYDSLNY